MSATEFQPQPVVMPQVNPSQTKCAGCRKLIPAGQRYVRLSYEPDGADPLGRDFHPDCLPAASQ